MAELGKFRFGHEGWVIFFTGEVSSWCLFRWGLALAAYEVVRFLHGYGYAAAMVGLPARLACCHWLIFAVL
jgi:hypothetical protein